MKTKFCTYCGILTDEEWSICPDCVNKIYEFNFNFNMLIK